MLVRLDHFFQDQDEDIKNKWNHHLAIVRILSLQPGISWNVTGFFHCRTLQLKHFFIGWSYDPPHGKRWQSLSTNIFQWLEATPFLISCNRISTTCKLISILFLVGFPKEISSHWHVGFWFEEWHATRSSMDCQCQHHHKWWLNDLYLPCDMKMSEYRNSTNPMSKDWFLYQTRKEYPGRPDVYISIRKTSCWNLPFKFTYIHPSDWFPSVSFKKHWYSSRSKRQSLASNICAVCMSLLPTVAPVMLHKICHVRWWLLVGKKYGRVCKTSP